MVNVNGPSEKPHVQLSGLEDGGGIVVAKASGMVIWSSPRP